MGLDDLLVLWDVMFADSPELKLAEYVAVAMLLAIRDRRMCAQMRISVRQSVRVQARRSRT
jgi:hypothetical protein